MNYESVEKHLLPGIWYAFPAALKAATHRKNALNKPQRKMATGSTPRKKKKYKNKDFNKRNISFIIPKNHFVWEKKKKRTMTNMTTKTIQLT